MELFTNCELYYHGIPFSLFLLWNHAGLCEGKGI